MTCVAVLCSAWLAVIGFALQSGSQSLSGFFDGHTNAFESAEFSRGVAVAEVFEMDADALEGFGNRAELLLVNVGQSVNCLRQGEVIGGCCHV